MELRADGRLVSEELGHILSAGAGAILVAVGRMLVRTVPKLGPVLVEREKTRRIELAAAQKLQAREAEHRQRADDASIQFPIAVAERAEERADGLDARLHDCRAEVAEAKEEIARARAGEAAAVASREATQRALDMLQAEHSQLFGAVDALKRALTANQAALAANQAALERAMETNREQAETIGKLMRVAAELSERLATHDSTPPREAE